MKNFFRKVAFGLKPDEKAPSDPLVWAQKQVEIIPEFNWKGKHIYSEKEMRKYWITQRVEENTTLRKKYKNDPEGFRRAERKLEADTGKQLWPANELCIRHAEGLRSDHPVLAKLWYFWGNHFTISDTQTLASYSTGAYQRDFIRANMDKNFETMATEATLAWPMIMHLDNKENVGPKSEDAKAEWRRRKKRPATINENHARELLELHTVSPNSGYTQDNITELALIMTGWAPDDKYWKTKLETADVKFQRKYHEPGKKIFWGKEFPKGSKGLRAAVNFLVNHPSCREFIAYKLCRYLITDYPTKEMTDPIINAWQKSDGFLPEVHKAAIEVAFKFNDKYSKFQNPENWWLQMSRMTDAKWPPKDERFDTYRLGGGPDPYQAKPSWFMEDIGHHPYLSKQPNGYSDLAEDWMSPELIIRRLIYARQGYINLKSDNKNNEFFEKVVDKNFDNPDKIMKLLNQNEKPIDRHILLFNLPEVFRA